MKRENLSQLRISVGTRAVVADRLGISAIHLRKLENGDVNPSAHLMIRMCKFFKNKPELLFPDMFVENDASVDNANFI